MNKNPVMAHRDIKTDNVLIEHKKGEYVSDEIICKLTDFGLSREIK